MDVKSAYLNGTLSEEIYMDQPEGYIHGDGKVCQLQKSLYGLKQAGCAWYKKIDEYFGDLNLQRTNVDNCVYYRQNGEKILIVMIYVDDILILSNNTQDLNDLKKSLNERFDMTDLSEASYCLGI